ncbi:protein of unknown function (plasmid) [Shinella sp. WSC3-e]|nr:protein of unknown function [Shinella sp. WSC3-e]
MQRTFQDRRPWKMRALRRCMSSRIFISEAVRAFAIAVTRIEQISLAFETQGGLLPIGAEIYSQKC